MDYHSRLCPARRGRVQQLDASSRDFCGSKRARLLLVVRHSHRKQQQREFCCARRKLRQDELIAADSRKVVYITGSRDSDVCRAFPIFVGLF